MPLNSIVVDNKMLPPLLTPKSAGRPGIALTCGASGHAGDCLDTAYNQVGALRNLVAENERNIGDLRSADNRIIKTIPEYLGNVQLLDNSRIFLTSELESNKAGQDDIAESQPPLHDALYTERGRDKAVDSTSEVTKPIMAHLEQADAGTEAELEEIKKRAEDLQLANKCLQKDMQAARERELRLRIRLQKIQDSKDVAERNLRESVDGKENLENEVMALSTLNGRLAMNLQEQNTNLSALENLNRSNEARIRELQDQRQRSDQQTQEPHHEISKLYELDADRRTQLKTIMQQAASVEGHIETALQRMTNISEEYLRHKDAEKSLMVEQEEAKKQLEIAQSKLTLASNAEEANQLHLDASKEREVMLVKEGRKLRKENSALAEQLSCACDELIEMRKVANNFGSELEVSKTQSIELRRIVEDGRRHNHRLEEELIRTQKEKREVGKKLTFLGSSLYASSSANSKLLSRLARFESDLGAALNENDRLEGLVEETRGDLNAANESFAARDEKHTALVAESVAVIKQQERSLEELEELKRTTEERLSGFRYDIERLANANSSLQNVLDTLGQGVEHVKQQRGDGQEARRSFRRERLSRIGFGPTIDILEGDLSRVQDIKALLDGIVVGLLTEPRSDDDEKARSKQDPVLDIASPLISTAVPSREVSLNKTPSYKIPADYSRQTAQENGHSVSQGSSSAENSTHQSAATHIRGSASWSSSESTLLGKKRPWKGIVSMSNVQRLPAPESPTSQFNRSKADNGLAVGELGNILRENRGSHVKHGPRESNRLASARNSIEATRLRCRSSPNLSADIETWQNQCQSEAETEVPPVPVLEDALSCISTDSQSRGSVYSLPHQRSSSLGLKSTHRLEETVPTRPRQNKNLEFSKSPEIPEEFEDSSDGGWAQIGTGNRLTLHDEGIRKSKVRKILTNVESYPPHALETARSVAKLSAVTSDPLNIVGSIRTVSPYKEVKEFDFAYAAGGKAGFGTTTAVRPASAQILRKSKSINFMPSKRESAMSQQDFNQKWKGTRKGWVGTVMEKMKGSKLKHNVNV